jgi:metal-responsive CopG/Arc/MetJ family transcriptional regulator
MAEKRKMTDKKEVMVSVRLPKELVYKIDMTALEAGKSRSGMIREMVDRYPAAFARGIRE